MDTSTNETVSSPLERGVLYAIDTFEEKRFIQTTALVETSNEVYMITADEVEALAEGTELLAKFREAVQEVVDNADSSVSSVTIIAEVKYSVIPHTSFPASRTAGLSVEEEPKDALMVCVEKADSVRTAIADVARNSSGQRELGEWCEVPEAFLNGLTGFLKDPSSIYIN